MLIQVELADKIISEIIDNQTPRPSPRRKTNNLNRNTRLSNTTDMSQAKSTTIMCAISSKILDHAHMATDVNLGIFNNISTMLPTLTV